MRHLHYLLTSSEAGDTMHHLVVAAAPMGPLGVPDIDRCEVSLYGIAPTGPGEVQELIGKSILLAAVEAEDKNRTILFAALSEEVWAVPRMDDLAHRLQAGHRLHEHPDAVEVTLVYGASSDGRRWRGRRWITGDKAGTSEDAEVLVGRPQPGEGSGVPAAPMLRRLVGIS